MDAKKQEALVDVIRAIIGDAAISHERIVALLQEAGNDPNKAVDLFFQTEAANGAEFKQNDVEGDVDDAEDGSDKSAGGSSEWSAKAIELNDLLGGDVKREVILDLLKRTKNNLQKAVEIYFVENGGDADEEFDEDEEDEGDAESAVKKSEPPAAASPSSVLAPPTEDAQPAPPPAPITPSPSSEALPLSPSAQTPIETHQLEPLTPPSSHPQPAKQVPDAATPSSDGAAAEALNGPGTYEVIMVNSNFRWQIGNVFGRAVVQQVEAGGPAALAGIQKADVLLSFRETVLNEQNCAMVVQQLSKERVIVPSALRFRRAPDAHPSTLTPSKSAAEPHGQSTRSALPGSSTLESNHIVNGTTKTITQGGPPENGAAEQSNQHDADGDVVMTAVDQASEGKKRSGPVDPKYGLQFLSRAVESMMDAVAGPDVELKPLVDLLLVSEFSLDRAVNTFLNEDRVVSDFRGIIGHDWDPQQPSKVMGGQPPYEASIPSGPLGLTVENILERTIVVDIKAGGAAERASVKKSSWLVALNGTPITHLTHKETLRMIETASRPLRLDLILVPQPEYKALRKQLAMNIRQQKTERPIPEQDRMSFRVFQMKIHQAILAFPKVVVVALFQYLSTEEYHPPTVDPNHANPLDRLLPSADEWDTALLQEMEAMDEDSGEEMCAERRFLLNLFVSIHEYDDKGENTVIRTIQFLGWLAVRATKMNEYIRSKQPPIPCSRDVYRHRYELMLGVVMYVIEGLSIIENHATWDVMVNVLKMLLRALSDNDIDKLFLPMFARLSISSSPTARIVPIALLSLVYPRVQGDPRVQLRGMLDRLCSDDNPLVRRAVSSVIADLAIAGGKKISTWTVQLLEKGTADSHDIVRIFAVKACIKLAKNLREVVRSDPDSGSDETSRVEALRLLFCQMVPLVNTYTSDSSWQVRLETARTLPEFCREFGAEYSDIFVDHFVAMVRDPTVEVRRACAEGAFLIGEALVDIASQKTGSDAASGVVTPSKVAENQGDVDIDAEPVSVPHRVSLANSQDELVLKAQAKIVKSVLPATYGLSTDVSVAVRLALAKSVGKSLQFIGSQHYDELVPIFAQFLDDSQDAMVRASLLEEMARYSDSASETLEAMMRPCVGALQTSPHWRVRVKFVDCVAAWADREDGAPVPDELADACLTMLGDAVHEVRAVVCQKLPVLARALGSEWLTAKCVPRVSACFQSTFNNRVTGLLAIEFLANDLKKQDKLRDMIEIVVEECTSKTPNLRFRSLRALAQLAPLLNDPQTTSSALEIVRQLALPESEADRDVREAAEATQAALETALS